MPQNKTNKDVVKRTDSTRENTPLPTSKGKNYLFAIAIDDYENCPRLFNCLRDAQGLIDILTEKYDFQPAYIRTLFNQEATEGNIFRTFREIAKVITPLDNLIIFFSGHGEYDKVFGEGYWIPIDAKEGAQEDYIANSKIKTFLDAIPSQHTFLIVDSCFSGSLFTQFKNVTLANRLSSTPSRWGLTAGRNEIVADGTAGTNSPFAKELLYQLNHATTPLGVANLCNKVIETVIANANQTPRGEPLKISGHKGGQYFFWPKGYTAPEGITVPANTQQRGTEKQVITTNTTASKIGVPKCSIYVSITLMALLAIGFFNFSDFFSDTTDGGAIVAEKTPPPPPIEENGGVLPPKKDIPIVTKPVIEEVRPTTPVIQKPETTSPPKIKEEPPTSPNKPTPDIQQQPEKEEPPKEEIPPLPIVLKKASKGGKYGFKDVNSGVWIVAPQYKLVTGFSGGLAAVQDFNYKWGYLNEQGKLVIPNVIDQPTKFGNKNRVRVMIKSEWVTINKMGKVQVGDRIMDLEDFINQ